MSERAREFELRWEGKALAARELQAKNIFNTQIETKYIGKAYQRRICGGRLRRGLRWIPRTWRAFWCGFRSTAWGPFPLLLPRHPWLPWEGPIRIGWVSKEMIKNTRMLQTCAIIFRGVRARCLDLKIQQDKLSFFERRLVFHKVQDPSVKYSLHSPHQRMTHRSFFSSLGSLLLGLFLGSFLSLYGYSRHFVMLVLSAE